VMVLSLINSLQLADSIVSLHTRVLKAGTNVTPGLRGILHLICVGNDAREDNRP